jgi:alkylation response protein AidB-like acyl-CoA dehydrogenase
MGIDAEVERQVRAELSRIVGSARSRRRLAERIDHGDDAAVRRQLSELGLLEAVLPDGSGAADGGLELALLAVEEVAVGLVAPGLLASTLALWTALAAGPRPADSDPDPRLTVAGAATVAWPGMLAGPEPVRPVAGEAALTGRLGYVPGGSTAEHLVLVWPQQGGTAAVVYLVGLDGAGREPLAVLDRSRPAAAVRLRSAPSRALGRLSGAALARLRAAWLVAVAADCLGGMRSALDAAVGYARERRAFGRSIGSFQAVRHRCAEMFVRVETVRAVVRGATEAVAEGDPEALTLALAAASHAMDAFCRVAEGSILVHGALGFTYECDAHFYARRAYANAALLGGVERLRAELVAV